MFTWFRIYFFSREFMATLFSISDKSRSYSSWTASTPSLWGLFEVAAVDPGNKISVPKKFWNKILCITYIPKTYLKHREDYFYQREVLFLKSKGRLALKYLPETPRTFLSRGRFACCRIWTSILCFFCRISLASVTIWVFIYLIRWRADVAFTYASLKGCTINRLDSRVYQNLATSSENYRTFPKVGPHYKEKACKFLAHLITPYALTVAFCSKFSLRGVK